MTFSGVRTCEKFELGVHRWTFPMCTIQEAASIASALGFTYLDLGNSHDHDPELIAEDPPAAVSELLRLQDRTGVAYRDSFLHFPVRFSTNHPSAETRAANLTIAAAYFSFASRLGLTGVTLSPGQKWGGENHSDAMKRSAAALQSLTDVGDQNGIQVRIEPHVGSVTESVEATLELLNSVPRLSLTLDYSHYVCNGTSQEKLTELRPHATHWHVRQASPGKLQDTTENGTVDVTRLLNWWLTSGYEGGVTLEYVHSPWMQQDNVDCLSETVKLRDQLRTLLHPSKG